jgi:hypothetical protein
VGWEISFIMEVGNAYKILVEMLKGRDNFGGVDTRTKL